MEKKLIVALLFLSSCAAKPVWDKPGATTADFGTDKLACMQNSVASVPTVAGVSGSGSSFANGYGGSSGFAVRTKDLNAGTRDEMFKACMESKGWLLQKPMPPPPPVENSDVTLGMLMRGPVNNPRIKQADIQIHNCIQNRTKNIFNHAQSAECVSDAMRTAFVDIGYPYLDLIDELNTYHEQCAAKIDTKKMTEGDCKLSGKKKLNELVAEEAKRKAASTATTPN